MKGIISSINFHPARVFVEGPVQRLRFVTRIINYDLTITGRISYTATKCRYISAYLSGGTDDRAE